MSKLKEFESLIQQEDFSQLSRKLLDLSVETTLPSHVEDQIYSLRKLYLADASKVELQEKTKSIIEQIPVFTDDTTIQKSSMCEATNISKRFVSGHSPFYLKPLSVQLNSGEITGIVGENGNGKTTLLRILAGELSSDTGNISYPSIGTDDSNWYSAKQHFAFIPQRIPKWHGSLVDNLRFFASIHGFTSNENTKQIEYILFRLGLDKFRHLKWSEISSGYRLRFELAKAIMWRPKLILLDEPLANLDINAQQLFLQDLKFFVKSSKFPLSVVLSSQQLHEVESVSDNIIFIKQGETIYNGNQTSFANDRITNTFELFGNFSQDQLKQVFPSPDIKIEDAGTTMVVTTPTEMTLELFLKTLIESNIVPTYFRDISTSTRKLFHRDI